MPPVLSSAFAPSRARNAGSHPRSRAAFRETAAASGHDVESALGAGSLDRVTLYRVLDWLVESGLAVKGADERRVWRFSLASGGTHGITPTFIA
ncbi:MAG: hypothetical protein IPL58_10055 [Betaproteobacteria bacterium]|uniref:Uncharacterized protein n=1 Tax=Candidatus Proximibacter danicus TaxID=2954365 RepID=A0A9D7K2U6_9PROT|nr:hypothetical protein [Candidatus Proximibacter danicus]